MSYKVVDRATYSPGQCFITGDYDGPFFDFGDKIVGPQGQVQRVYVHVPVIEACARQLGWSQEASERLSELAARVAELEPKAAAWDALESARKVPA